MQKTLFAAMGLALAATSFPASAEAGPFDKLRSKVKKVEKKAKEVEAAAEEVKEVVDTVDSARRGKGRRAVRVPGGRNAAIRQGMRQRSNYPKTASRGDFAGVAAPVPAKFVSQLQCANVNPGNAFVGRGGNYTFSQGIKTEERSGIIDRKPVRATNGCLYPTMGVGDILYVEVDRAKYKKHGYAMQCVSYDGSEQLDNTGQARWNNYAGKDVMLHTGHSLGYTPTATGSNSTRSGEYDKWLKSRGREMITFNFGALHTDKSGTDFYCQWYDKSQNKSAVAFAFRRGPVGR